MICYYFVILISLVSISSCFDCYTCNNLPEEDDTQPCIERIEECPEGVRACSSVTFKDVNGILHRRKFCTSTGIPLYSHVVGAPGSAVCQNIEPDAASPTNGIKPRPPGTTDDESVIRPQTIQDVRPPPLLNQLHDFELTRRKRAASEKQLDQEVGPPSEIPRMPSARQPMPPGHTGRLMEPIQFNLDDSLNKEEPKPPAPPSFYVSTLLCICTKDLCNAGDFPDVVNANLLQNMRGPLDKSGKSGGDDNF